MNQLRNLIHAISADTTDDPYTPASVLRRWRNYAMWALLWFIVIFGTLRLVVWARLL